MAPKGRKMVLKRKAVLSTKEPAEAALVPEEAAEGAPESPKAPKVLKFARVAKLSKMLKRPARAESTVSEELEAAAADVAPEEEETGAAEAPKKTGRMLKRPAAAMSSSVPEAEVEASEEPKSKGGRKAKADAATPAQAKAPAAPVAAEVAEKVKAPKAPKPLSKTEEMLKAVHRTIASIQYKACPAAGVRLHPAGLTSFDADGFPSTRTVVPSFMADDLSEIKVSSQVGTRKELEINADPKVSLHFQDQRGKGGWVTMKGKAQVEAGSDPEKVTITLRPERIEAMSYIEGLMGDEDGWKPASLVKVGSDSWRRVN